VPPLPEASPPEAERTWWLVCAFAEKERKKARKYNVLVFIGFIELLILRKFNILFFITDVSFDTNHLI
jgi:hypothetical protein